jgi:hypothetical protein
MNRAALVKRLEAIESKRRAITKPVDLSRFFAKLAVLFVAKLRKRHESMLVAYARACRYRGGVAELFEAAYHAEDFLAARVQTINKSLTLCSRCWRPARIDALGETSHPEHQN